MSEGLAVYGNDVYLAYESGASYYRFADNKPRNIITNLHKTPLSWLEGIARR